MRRSDFGPAGGGGVSAYDGLILGAGHNGLILAAYLAKAGLRVLLVERRAGVGGGAETFEDPRHPGFLHNTHAFFQRAITTMPWYRDLELERHGLSYVEPRLNVALVTGDGRALCWWTDFERTVESFRGFSVRDAQTLRRWRDEFVPIVHDILTWEGRSPPLPRERRRSLLEASAAGRKLLEAAALSPLEFVHTEFENPTVRPGSCSSTGCAKSICGCAASATISRRFSRARRRRKCREAAARRSRARSKMRCARPAAESR